MDDIYKNIEEYNPNKKLKMLIFFHDMIADMLNYKRLNSIVIKFFIRGRKINISFFLLHNLILLNIRLNSAHCFIMKVISKRKLQQIAFYHSSDIDFLNFMNLYKKNVLKNHILFWLLMLLLHLIIFYVLEIIFQKEYKN